ncbi:vacuolar fusion protein CCZ1 [Ceratobasidium sp. AG-Ba]|nr:vacuolar fusion protein CCZ1 [Ceratobasidium sp. AG-Ba]
MSRVSAALAYLVIYNPTLQPNPEESNEGRDEDDVTEQAHILFYTARESTVSRDRILRQVGLAKALANFAEMFTSQPGFDNVHAQKSRLVMISPEPNFWIHACVDLAKTPKASAAKNVSSAGADSTDDFEYHSNSLNDDVIRTQLMQAFQTFKLQHGGFAQIMQSDGVRALERCLESFFTPWAWQWNLAAAPEFGTYLGLPIHHLNKQLAVHLNEYVSHIPNTPTVVLAPPNIITNSALTPISPLPPLVRFLEPIVPTPKPKPPPSAPSPAATPGTSTPKHMLAASGNAVTKYITKPAAQVVDPRNWSWPTYMTFGKGSMRSKDKERGKIPSIDTTTEGIHSGTEEKLAEDSKKNDRLGIPADQDATSRASRSVSPSTVDRESLLEAQQDARLDNTEANVDFALNLALSTPLPAGSDSGDSPVEDVEENEHVLKTPRAATKLPPPESSNTDEHSKQDEDAKSESVADHSGDAEAAGSHPAVTGDRSFDSSHKASSPVPDAGFINENTPAPPAAPEIAHVQVELSTRVAPETTSGSLHLWLDSLGSGSEESTSTITKKQKVTWVAVPGLLVASIVGEDLENSWKDAAQELLFSLYETIQSRQLTAAETTLRALSTTKIVAHYPISQMSASSTLPQFTSESPNLFMSAHALQFSTAPTIREIITQTRWGTWCAARQSTPGTRLYVEVDRKDANLVDVDQELASACRRWEETDD